MNTLLAILFAILCLPAMLVIGEVLLGLFHRPRAEIPPPPDERFSYVLLVPAHNEVAGIADSVRAFVAQCGPRGRVVVVADNCSDDTAELAAKAGATVVVRHDTNRRGKGYALAFGRASLAADPPDVVVIADADCRFAPGALRALAWRSGHESRPIQIGNHLELPDHPDPKRCVAAFAWMVKTRLRPLGLASLGLPCQIMGTGFAVPWRAYAAVPLASGNIVEDVQLGLDLAAQGAFARFAPDLRITSPFPTTDRGFASQRQRWEEGALRTAFSSAPQALMRSFAGGDWCMAALAADLMVPPLMMLLLSMCAAMVLLALLGACSALLIVVIVFAGLFLVLLLAWAREGRDVLPPGMLARVPGVIVRKVLSYWTMWRSRGAGWVRTDRDG
ncbi:glycosyltransferase family 2 protein [Aestuariivirga sp.]|uniref:glycosyltransferase family 2 protein n=1 Tax=Aestuariivirga sp. TaxID=2650926 RepID=UPI0039E70769